MKIFKEENIFTQHDVENKQSKEENEKLRKKENEKLRKEENEKLQKENEQLRKDNKELRKNNIVNDSEVKGSVEKPIRIKSPEEDKNSTDSYPNWFDKNKFKNTSSILALKTWLIIFKIIQLVKYLLKI